MGIGGDHPIGHLHGGAGADRFQFFAGHRVDLIADFQNGMDKIDFFSGPTRFEDLAFVQSGANTVIQHAGSRIIVADADVGEFDRSDFWFA